MIHPLAVEALRAISPLHAATLANKFTFVMNGLPVEADVADAAALSPAVALQLSVDSCSRRFVVDEVHSDAIPLFKDVLSCARSRPSASGDDERSLSVLFGQLRNPLLEFWFLFLSGRDSVRFRSSSLSLLSLEALDLVLSKCEVYDRSADSLFERIINLGPVSFPLLRHVRWDELSPVLLPDSAAAAWGAPCESVWSGVAELMGRVLIPPPAGFASLIVSQFPALFAEFGGKRFTLLWRGSRDGFGGRDFHRRCDGHANTLTLILDRKGNIFGGFTPVEWEPRERTWNSATAFGRNNYKADPSLKSFLFTLKNPHNFRARKFALKAEKKDEAIDCHPSSGPDFRDIHVGDNCHECTASGYSGAGMPYLLNFTRLGRSYANDTGLEGSTFFTGSEGFAVKEIEVFEITD
jgi:hypothetical protein